MQKKTHIAVLLGSVRPENLTGQFLRVVVEELERHAPVSIDLIDPLQLRLVLPGEPGSEGLQSELVARINAASGVVLSTPEYHGSYSSVIKLMLDNTGYPSALAGKPVALLGVASGQIGAVKALEHLRSVCSHMGALVLPYPVSIAGAHALVDERGRLLSAEVEQQLRGLAVQLLDYVHGARHAHLAFDEIMRSELDN